MAPRNVKFGCRSAPLLALGISVILVAEDPLTPFSHFVPSRPVYTIVIIKPTIWCVQSGETPHIHENLERKLPKIAQIPRLG